MTTPVKYLINDAEDADLKVDFQGTGETVTLNLVNQVAIMEMPPDPSTGETTSVPMDMKFISETISVRGTFKDGLGSNNITSGTTKHERLWALFSLEVKPLKFYWGHTAAKTFHVSFTRYTMTETAGHIEVDYDVTLSLVAAP